MRQQYNIGQADQRGCDSRLILIDIQPGAGNLAISQKIGKSCLVNHLTA